MEEFYTVLHNLKLKLPTKYPVVVKIVNPESIKGSYGQIYRTKKRFIIKIAKGNTDVMKLILIHEYAHALTNIFNETNWHGEEWGIAYSKCWKVYTGE